MNDLKEATYMKVPLANDLAIWHQPIAYHQVEMSLYTQPIIKTK